MDDQDPVAGALAPLRGLLTAAQLDELRAAHERVGWNCAARGEGLTCCLDVLLKDDP